MTATAAFVVLAIVWGLFGLIYVTGRRGAAPETKTTVRSPASRLGIAMQLLAYAIAFVLERPTATPIVPMSATADTTLLIAATVLGVVSLVFCRMAARTLGKQWSMTARVVAEHELIQRGPFAIVRNPIYLGMFGLLVHAALVLATWEAAAAAMTLFLIGTWIRIREEEKILRRQFGATFEDYAGRVPAFLPFNVFRADRSRL